MTDIDKTPLTLGDLKTIAVDAYNNGLDGPGGQLGGAIRRFEAQKREEQIAVELAKQTPYIKVRFRVATTAAGKVYKLASGRAKVGDAVTVTSSASFGVVGIVTEINTPKPPLYQQGYTSNVANAVLIDPADRKRIEKALGRIA